MIVDQQKLDPSAIIELFELDTTSLGGGLYRWCNEVNEFGNDVVWNGNQYTALPIEASGFERIGSGKQPRPKLRAANITGVIGVAAGQYDDFVGAKLTRIRTFVKYLDAANFVAGNPSADPNTSFPDEIWFVDRKASENGLFIEFELASAMDMTGVKLPRRNIIKNTCPWQYRSAECGYAGGPVANKDDAPVTDLTDDVCGKRVSSCKLRFGEDAELPFGGFVGIGLI